MDPTLIVADGNEACASVAYRTNEVIAIYPITPASPMGELADTWAQAGRKNILGTVPQVVEMQSEAGAAGAVHGALTTGALTTTFTASQGLLLMLPNMFKIAGELTPAVFHIASRAVATHALSIFGDHSDVMAARTTGWGMLCSGTVQETHDFALIASMASLASRVPIMHFFDGFRTSHEINKIALLADEDLQALIDMKTVLAHRERALDPERPVLRGTAQNPDVFFQAREAINPYYDDAPRLMQDAMDRFAARVGRAYRLFEYSGHPEADRVIVLMGSGAGAALEAADALSARGERVGVVRVRLFRPFAVDALLDALPKTTRRIAVLDRTKEPGAIGEPLYQDVVTALEESWPDRENRPAVRGGRYGLASKEFTPAMAAAVYDDLARDDGKRRFTIGIVDDVTHLSLPWDRDAIAEPDDVTRAVFFGLGSDGTVGATKTSVKIIGQHTNLHAQGYFVYDSKKSGAVTISHLRFGPRPIGSSYLIDRATFVACHQYSFVDRLDILETAAHGATFLLNAPYAADRIWDRLPVEMQTEIIEKKIRFFVIDAARVARDADLGRRINTVMQTCFFALSGVLPQDEALERIRDAIRTSYGKRGETVVTRNLEAVDAALDALAEVTVPDTVTSTTHRRSPVPDEAPDFVRRITALMIAGKGDRLPVSALPVDGTFPTGTAAYEKRGIAHEIPIWEPELCIDCGLCTIMCPHAAIRMKRLDSARADDAPSGFRTKAMRGKDHDGHALTIQVAPDDCTGCGVCVDVCPAHSKSSVRHRALNMAPRTPHLDAERANFAWFLDIPEVDRRDIRLDQVAGTQFAQPLFEFSGACAGCGETPYLKLLTQLFGDRILIANATGCSSIFGGNLPTTPWTRDAAGRGPAWSNSLFEDNAEFGLGMRLALDGKRDCASALLGRLGPQLAKESLAGLAANGAVGSEDELYDRRALVESLKERLGGLEGTDAAHLLAIADVLTDRGVWIVGGDGWAYDIGFGGLDHVIASGRNVNILVLDTEVYSNTGGQASKATPRAAVAKYAAGGKPIGKKDLGMLAMAYGNAYVAQVAIGANPRQCLTTFREAAAYPGPSLIIAYAHCIAHGIDMTTGMHHQKDAVDCGYWSLYRYDPRRAHVGEHPLHLDSRRPTKKFRDFAAAEARFAMLEHANPDNAERLMSLAQADIDERWHLYEQMVGVERTVPDQEVTT